MASNYDTIRTDNIRKYGEETDHLAFLGELYPTKNHFLFELLQNAEDAKATCVAFKLFNDRLEVTHDGRPFNEADVVGICGVRKGTKAKDLTQIGKFGIGFKSVYAYTSNPEVHSGDEHFRINKYVRPWAAEQKSAAGSMANLFIFPFDAIKAACDEISEGLRKLNARTLLFLRNINEIKYRLPDQTEGVYQRKEVDRKPAREVTVIGRNNGKEVGEKWLVFERAVPVPDGSGQVRVEAAFMLEPAGVDRGERIIKADSLSLVVYFPTEKETKLGFLIQGPYRTTPARDNIPADDDWNKKLVQETAQLIADTLPQLKQMGLLTISLLEALPIRAGINRERDYFPEGSMFRPIFAKVRETLRNSELLPADDGTFVAPKNARLAGAADLRGLLNQEQLQSLFQLAQPAKWLNREITKDRTPELYWYLHYQLEVEEVDADKFASTVSEAFLKNQPDEWFISLYGYLVNQKGLWQAAEPASDSPYNRRHERLAGPLRTKPILRLEDSSQAAPFEADGKTRKVYLPPEGQTDFPTVKRAIAGDPRAKEFLKGLGLSEPDICDEVIKKVLPKYERSAATSISPDEHKADLEKIFRAMKSDSKDAAAKVLSAAKDAPFLKAVDQIGNLSFKKPGEVYADTKDLRLYFSGSSDIWFLHPDNLAGVDSLGILGKLGVADLPRPVLSDELSADAMRYKTRYPQKWQKKTFPRINNYDLDGLDSFLKRLAGERDIDYQAAKVLWHYLVEYSEPKPQTLFKLCCSDGWKVTKFDTRALERLKAAKWVLTKNGELRRPIDITFEELPDELAGAEALIDLLEIGRDDSKISKELGISVKSLRAIKANPKWIERILEEEGDTTSDFPSRTVANPSRRAEKILEQVAIAPKKRYEMREQNVRTEQEREKVRAYLTGAYTNGDKMYCQICEKAMPFKKRNGQYYFEAVESLSLDHLPKEHEAQYLALCPVCAARYQEFVKNDPKAMKGLREALMKSDDLKVPVKLGDLVDARIRFVAIHHFDIKQILHCAHDGGNQAIVESQTDDRV